jgi:hypothetical protein
MMVAPVMDVMAAPMPSVTYSSTVGALLLPVLVTTVAVFSTARPSAATMARSREHATLAEWTHGVMEQSSGGG